MSLLSWIWDGIRGLIEDLINAVNAWIRPYVKGLVTGVTSFAENLVDGVRSALENTRKILGDSISSLRGYWTNFTSKTLPDLWAGIGNLRISLSVKITQSIGDVRIWVATQILNTRIFVNSQIAKAVPRGFIRNPIGYIQAAFNGLVEFWIHGAVKSFWAGFEEGLKEEEG